MTAFRAARYCRATIAAGLVAAMVAPAFAAQHTSLTIGITQYPGTLNPNFAPPAAKSYVLGFAVQPFTVYDANWKLVCLLCMELPSIENGMAVPADLGSGKRGIDLTYTIRPDPVWGDGMPVTTDDVLFAYEVGRNPQSAVGDVILLESVLSFLGLGVQPPLASWGSMLSNAQNLIESVPTLAIYPGAMIFLTVVACNLLGDGLQRRLAQAR